MLTCYSQHLQCDTVCVTTGAARCAVHPKYSLLSNSDSRIRSMVCVLAGFWCGYSTPRSLHGHPDSSPTIRKVQCALDIVSRSPASQSEPLHTLLVAYLGFGYSTVFLLGFSFGPLTHVLRLPRCVPVTNNCVRGVMHALDTISWLPALACSRSMGFEYSTL